MTFDNQGDNTVHPSHPRICKGSPKGEPFLTFERENVRRDAAYSAVILFNFTLSLERVVEDVDPYGIQIKLCSLSYINKGIFVLPQTGRRGRCPYNVFVVNGYLRKYFCWRRE